MTQESKDHPFINYLQKHTEDRAMLAELRRGLGQQPGEAPGMFPYVVPFVTDWNEADIYMLASLFALHPSSTISGNMGDHLYRLAHAQDGNEEATTRRFVQLLRMNRDALEPRLRQHINLLKSNEIAVNWHQLIMDVNRRYWDHPDRFVQKKWASSYWKSSSKS